jgi:hypothetical protein
MRIRFEPAKALTFRWTAQYADEASAEAGAKALKFVADQLVVYMGMSEQGIPPMLKSTAGMYPDGEKLGPIYIAAVQAASAAVKAADIKRDGINVSMVCTIKTDHPVTDAILLLSLMPRAAKK